MVDDVTVVGTVSSEVNPAALVRWHAVIGLHVRGPVVANILPNERAELLGHVVVLHGDFEIIVLAHPSADMAAGLGVMGLLTAIDAALSTVTGEDCRGFFRHCGYDAT